MTVIQNSGAEDLAAEDLAAEVARLLADLRATRPLVQAVTNFVSMDVAANALLAIGASPAMVHAPEEADEFIALANALVVNIGTLSKSFVLSMEAAALAAHMHGRPWVLDPVGAGATRFRDEAVKQLLRHRPAVIRGNASEILSVARIAGLHRDDTAPKGVDSAQQPRQRARWRSSSRAINSASSPRPAPSISLPMANASSNSPTARR